MATICTKCGREKKGFLDIFIDGMCVDCQSNEKSQKQLEIGQMLSEAKKIVVSTTDLNKPYRIIAPIIFNTSNRGLFASAFKDLKKKYEDPIYKQLLVTTEPSPSRMIDSSWIFNTLEGPMSQGDFDIAFHICIAEMKQRAYQLGGNAIVGMRMDFDLDTTHLNFFYIQTYGTVVMTHEPLDTD